MPKKKQYVEGTKLISFFQFLGHSTIRGNLRGKNVIFGTILQASTKKKLMLLQFPATIISATCFHLAEHSCKVTQVDPNLFSHKMRELETKEREKLQQASGHKMQ